MAVKIRLRRMGKKKHPFYRIIATEENFSRDGKYLEVVGHYNPASKEKLLEFKEERIKYWLENGAQPSEPVEKLMRQAGLKK